MEKEDTPKVRARRPSMGLRRRVPARPLAIGVLILVAVLFVHHRFATFEDMKRHVSTRESASFLKPNASENATTAQPEIAASLKEKIAGFEAGGNGRAPHPPSQPRHTTSAPKAAETVTPPPQKPKKEPTFAVALKSGAEVAAQRVPIQLITFMRDFPDHILIGDRKNVFVGSKPLVDVFEGLYDDEEHLAAELKRLNSVRKTANRSDTPSPFSMFKLLPAAFLRHEKKTTPRLQKREEVVADEGSQGWKNDAHKNLPGFKLLHREFPSADWYLMIDDDTYVVKQNLVDLVRKLDPTKPYYLGSAHYFNGCDGVRKLGDGPMFAQGGTGILVSQGAMRRMLGVIDGCIARYRSCWAGDVRTALCLRDAGVLVMDTAYFSPHPPSDSFSWPGNACAKPITFHHATQRQIQAFHDMEQSKRNSSHGSSLLRYADVFAAYARENSVGIRLGYNRRGFDYKKIVHVRDPRACRYYCQREAVCVAWSFDGASCWLKNGLGAVAADAAYFTGVFPERYTCKLKGDEEWASS